MTGWSDDDADAWIGARTREIAQMNPTECRSLLRRLAVWMAYDADRRAVWADEYWAATTHG